MNHIIFIKLYLGGVLFLPRGVRLKVEWRTLVMNNIILPVHWSFLYQPVLLSSIGVNPAIRLLDYILIAATDDGWRAWI